MSKTRHSKLPWVYMRDSVKKGAVSFLILQMRKHSALNIATTWHCLGMDEHEAEANAKFIVEACNAFADLDDCETPGQYMTLLRARAKAAEERFNNFYETMERAVRFSVESLKGIPVGMPASEMLKTAFQKAVRETSTPGIFDRKMGFVPGDAVEAIRAGANADELEAIHKKVTEGHDIVALRAENARLREALEHCLEMISDGDSIVYIQQRIEEALEGGHS